MAVQINNYADAIHANAAKVGHNFCLAKLFRPFVVKNKLFGLKRLHFDICVSLTQAIMIRVANTNILAL